MSFEEDNKPILLEDLGMMYATEKSKRKIELVCIGVDIVGKSLVQKCII